MADSSSFDAFLNKLASGSGVKGKGNIEPFRGTDISLGSHIPFGLATRVPALDRAIGRPGWPAGRVCEVFGFEHVGKTTLALAAIASAQRRGGMGAFIDAERSFSPSWARMNGCDPDRIVVYEVDTVEDVFKAHQSLLDTYMQMENPGPMAIVTDSITAVPCMEAIEKDYTDNDRLGVDARAIRRGLKKLNSTIAKSKVCCIFINHQISSMSQYAADESAGGHALKLWAGLRVKVALAKNLKDDKTKYFEGKVISVEVKKNKVGSTGATKFNASLLKNGFCLYENLLDAMVDVELVAKPNLQTYTFLPGTENAVNFKRKEWRTVVEEQTEGIDALYDWYLKKIQEKNLILPYGAV